MERLTERLADMAVFAAVVSSGGFTSAGRQTGLSKGAVSKAVARLETHLDARLLNRSTRHVEPTEAGRALFAYCQAVVQQADEAEQHLGEMRAGPKGILRMTAPLSFGVARISSLVPELTRRYPGLEVVLRLDDEVVDLVGERMDLALRAGPLPDSGLVARRVGRIGASIVAAPGYLAEHGRPTSPSDLKLHRCLRYGEHVHRWRLSTGEHAIGTGPAVNSTLAQLQLALAGGGLALLADYLSDEHVASGALVRVLDECTRVQTEVYAVHPYTRHVPAKVAVAMAFFAECIGDG